MPATNLMPTGTSAATSSDVVIADGSWATFVMTGFGKAFVEVKATGPDYIQYGELTTKAPVLKLQGPMTVRVRRALVTPTWVPSGMEEVTYPLGVDLYLDTSNLSAIAAGVGAPADAAASTDTGSFSLLSFVKRGLQNWATLLSRIPALISGAYPVVATPRVCLGTYRVSVTTASQTLGQLIATSIPAGAVTCEIQPDGGTIRIRRDGQTPTTTLGLRVDDGVEKMIDTPLADVRAISGGASNVPANVIFFDRV